MMMIDIQINWKLYDMEKNNINFPGHNFHYRESWEILQYTISAIYLKATGNHWMVSSVKRVEVTTYLLRLYKAQSSSM